MRRPYGCGEQNMFNFATNLYNIKFLKVWHVEIRMTDKKRLHDAFSESPWVEIFLWPGVTCLHNPVHFQETNQLGDDTLFDALEYMNLLLQRQTSYMSEEGAFSMFRDYREPTYSTW